MRQESFRIRFAFPAPVSTIVAVVIASVQCALADGPVATSTDAVCHHRTIVMDGNFDDWKDLQPVALGVSESGAFVNLAGVWAACDEDWVYFRIQTTTAINLQSTNGTISLHLNVDGDSLTGRSEPARPLTLGNVPGEDAVIHFSRPRDGGRFEGVAALAIDLTTSVAFNTYLIGLESAPTHSSTEFEMRIRRGATAAASDVDWFTSPRLIAKFSATSSDGKLVSETPAFALDLCDHGVGNAMADVPPYPGKGEVRVLSWNVQKGAIFSNSAPFARVLLALRPDIITFQEVGESTTVWMLRDWLDEHCPSARGWDVSMMPGSDAAVASRFSGVSLNPEEMPQVAGDREVKTSAMLAADGRKRAAVLSVHLKCCGRAGDERDQTRLAEAVEIHKQLRKIRYADNPSAIVVAGDFNLVGSREPLDTIALGNDLDGSDLAAVHAPVWGDQSLRTWRDPVQPFPPGRLDFVLVSDSVTAPVRAFVLDTTLLSESALNRLGLLADDTSASDHLPVVADLRW